MNSWIVNTCRASCKQVMWGAPSHSLPSFLTPFPPLLSPSKVYVLALSLPLGNSKCHIAVNTLTYTMYIGTIKWIAKNTQLKVIFFKNITRVSSHHLYYGLCSKCPPPKRSQALRLQSLTAHLITAWLKAACVVSVQLVQGDASYNFLANIFINWPNPLYGPVEKARSQCQHSDVLSLSDIDK